MSDADGNPERSAQEVAARDNVGLWVVVGLMVLIVVGGLAYGLAHPYIYANNPPQTVGSAAAHARSGHPL